jgi:hypothetical protein
LAVIFLLEGDEFLKRMDSVLACNHLKGLLLVIRPLLYEWALVGEVGTARREELLELCGGEGSSGRIYRP